MSAPLHIGTSGWTYKHWSAGVFYPEKMKQSDWLPYFMTKFDTVEINMSFYRLPNEPMIERWEKIAPKGFHYAVKLWRMITHMKTLRNADDLTEKFMGVVNGLKTKRGPLLVQLPPRLELDLDRLDEYLTMLKKIMGRMRWQIAVEFRNPTWIVNETSELLSKHHAAIVLHDMHGSETTRPNQSDFIYIRRHGSHYSGEYTEDQLQTDARNIRQWQTEGREVWIYYNNDAGGAAVRNALRLKQILA